MEDNKKIKNLFSAVIFLSGLFVGSLFVDVAQLVRGTGFSEKNLKKSEIFESTGKTWVAYEEPIANLKVISDDACENCDPSEALIWLRRVIPTISAQKISYDSEEAKQTIEKFSIRTLPAFVFDSKITKTDFYSQAQILFEQKDDQYILKTQELGLSPGKYLTTPKINKDDAVFGNLDAKVKVVAFSDFQCSYCKIFWSNLRSTMKQAGDQVLFDYKHLPLSIHAQAETAALASQCAGEQEKFWEYSDKLFTDQVDWTNTEGSQKFKEYAKEMGLKAENFNSCLDRKKYQNQIDSSVAEAAEFGISGTPAIFVNNQFRNGVISADDLKLLINQELTK